MGWNTHNELQFDVLYRHTTTLRQIERAIGRTLVYDHAFKIPRHWYVCGVAWGKSDQGVYAKFAEGRKANCSLYGVEPLISRLKKEAINKVNPTQVFDTGWIATPINSMDETFHP